MTYSGKVEKGVVVFENEKRPRDGAIVRVEEIAGSDSDDRQTIWEALRELDGSVEGLPADFAENHDHYIRGAPKRSEK